GGARDRARERPRRQQELLDRRRLAGAALRLPAGRPAQALRSASTATRLQIVTSACHTRHKFRATLKIGGTARKRPGGTSTEMEPPRPALRAARVEAGGADCLDGQGLVFVAGQAAHADRADTSVVGEDGDATLEERELRVEAGQLRRVVAHLRGQRA